MLTTDELTIETVFVELPRLSDLDARKAYNRKIAELEHQWVEWLAEEYASDLSVAVAAQIYIHAWSHGHSSGYSEVEGHYNTHADFARAVVAAFQE